MAVIKELAALQSDHYSQVWLYSECVGGPLA